MQMTELDPQNISVAIGVIPENAPIVMLNLLRYKQHADYGDGKDIYRNAFSSLALLRMR